MQQRHFNALLDAARLQPSAASSRLSDVASFMGAVAPSYKGAGAKLAPTVTAVLAECAPAMNTVLRRALVRLLALLRARNAVEARVVIPLFFRLLACNDKPLRRMLHGHIVSDLRRMQSGRGDASRRSLQSFLFAALDDPSDTLVKRTLHVLIDLFRKRVWNDPRCANMIASVCFHKSTPIAVIAARFLLDSNVREAGEDDSDDDDDEEQNRQTRGQDGRKAADMWKAYMMTGKKTTKKRKRMERVIARATRHKAASTEKGISGTDQASTAAMALLNDPQEFAEKLFSSLQTLRKRDKYETKLIFINLLTRLIGGNHLILFEAYSYLQRYLQPAQPEVTRVLAYLTQACHDLVPGDVLHPILRCIADKFVSERSSPPSVSAGINTIRAICARVPLAIFDAENENLPEDEQEAPLLLDLAMYKTDRDKGVGMASRSMIALYRELHPKLLRKRDRGRMAAEAVQKGHTASAPAYSSLKYSTGVDGVELLAENDSESELDMDEEEDTGNDMLQGEDASAEHHDEVANDNEDGSGEDGEIEVGETVDGVAASDHSNKTADGEVANDADDLDGDNEDDDNIESESDTETVSKPREDVTRLLTDQDFAKIRVRRAARAVEGVSSLRTRNAGDSVDPESLQGAIRRERTTLEDKLEKVLAGREGRGNYGSKKGLNKGGGSSNKQKKNTKANAMVLHKRRRTNKMSRRDRQISKNKKRDYK